MQYYALEQLKEAKIERIDIGDKLFDELDEKIRKSYDNCCILYIDKIINNKLNENYENLKKKLIEKRGENCIEELYLFHGTKNSSILGISEEGFKVSLNRVNAFGVGTYLSPNAKLASGYTNINKDDTTFLDGVEISYLIYCKALIGKKTIGKNAQLLNTEQFDVGVNSLKNTTIYSIPYDSAVLPLYIIAFYKNASI